MNFRGTTIVSVRTDDHVVVAGDGQVTMGEKVIMKRSARKVRRLYDGKVLCGFAGSTADAITLYEKLEEKLNEFGGNLTRAAVELAKDWRTDRMLRKLEALLIAADVKTPCSSVARATSSNPKRASSPSAPAAPMRYRPPAPSFATALPRTSRPAISVCTR